MFLQFNKIKGLVQCEFIQSSLRAHRVHSSSLEFTQSSLNFTQVHSKFTRVHSSSLDLAKKNLPKIIKNSINSVNNFFHELASNTMNNFNICNKYHGSNSIESKLPWS